MQETKPVKSCKHSRESLSTIEHSSAGGCDAGDDGGGEYGGGLLITSQIANVDVNTASPLNAQRFGVDLVHTPGAGVGAGGGGGGVGGVGANGARSRSYEAICGKQFVVEFEQYNPNNASYRVSHGTSTSAHCAFIASHAGLQYCSTTTVVALQG